MGEHGGVTLPKTKLIGLGHKARHGKDTVARHIVKACLAAGVDARQYAFANPLKGVARVLHKMTVKDAPLLQTIGLDYRTVYGPDVWLNATLWQIEEEAPEVAIISDVRYWNELVAVEALGGVTVRVHRPEFVDPSRPADHPSEVALDGALWDYTIENMSLHQLHINTLELLPKLYTRLGDLKGTR